MDKLELIDEQPYHEAVSMSDPPAPRDPVNEMILLNGTAQDSLNYYRSYDNSRARIEMLTVQLAEQSYKLTYGHYTTSLGGLVSQFMDSVPLDPFGQNTPYRYRLTGDSYILFSIGKDGVDDGGTPEHLVGGTDEAHVRGDIVAGVSKFGKPVP
jgi:hypothetical protein